MLKSQRTALSVILAMVCCWCLCLISSASAVGDPVSEQQASTVVTNWLSIRPAPLNERLGTSVQNVALYSGAQNHSKYYVVNLQPDGFVVVAADDKLEPILCFGAKGHFTPTANDPISELLDNDIANRLFNTARRTLLATPSGGRVHNKWQYLLSLSTANGRAADAVSIGNTPGPSDVLVAPFVQSQWNQTTSYFGNCFNYYTPENEYCGCVATALSQLMRYWEWPVKGVGTTAYGCTVDGVNENLPLRGGNGIGGPYNWSEMPLTPDLITTESSTLQTDYQQIGDLCYDAGVASSMEYSSSGSGAYLSDAQQALTQVFGYSNAIYTDFGAPTDQQLITTINPDLDAGLPVVLGIYNSSDGHCVLADGYGYDSGTLYHHLNVGWGSYWYTSQSIWYNLADPDITDDGFNVIGDVIYNIEPKGTGEVLSGVVTGAGLPLSGATVTASNGKSVYTTKSGTNGIYAFSELPSSHTYSVTSKFQSYSSNTLTCNIGLSDQNGPGNLWGNDLTIITKVPSLQSFSPLTGPVGTTVVVTGTNLTFATALTFAGGSSGLTAVPTNVTATSATAVVPAGAKTGTISITTPGGSSTSTAQFIVIPAPTISSFLPASAIAGVALTITGTDLTGASSVAFVGAKGLVNATPIKVSATSVTVDVPAGAESGVLTVTTPGGVGKSKTSFTLIPPPSILVFSPTSGPVGTSLIIYGSNLTGVTQVTFTGGATATPTTVKPTAVFVTVPKSAETGVVKLTSPDGVATSPNAFTVIPAPTITSFTPTSGSAGTTVVITGTNLTGAFLVTFAGGSVTLPTAIPSSVTATSAAVVVPAGSATGLFAITTPGGSAKSSSVFAVAPVPTITSFSPAKVSAGAGSTLIKIVGTNFTGATLASWNGHPLTSFTITNAENISGVISSLYLTAAASAPVKVTAPHGTATSSTNFIVTAPPTIKSFVPASGPVGTTITIIGTNLTGATSVTFAHGSSGVSAVPTGVTSTSATAIVPVGAVTGPISITTPYGTSKSSGVFTVIPPPIIVSFTPSSVAVGSPATKVTITGINFSGATAANWNGFSLTNLLVTGTTSVSGVLPASALLSAASQRLTLTTPGGTTTSSSLFSVTQTVTLSSITSFNPKVGPVGTTVTVIGRI